MQSTVPGPLALACEQFQDGFLGQPANTVTSLAFVVAAGALLWRRRPPGHRWPYVLLVAAVGIGSVVQHGPHPPWQAYAHDLPLAGLLAFVAADCLADLTGRRLRHWWWLLPTAAVAPLVAVGHDASTAGQVVLAVLAIGLGLVRAWVRPPLRRVLVPALGILALGALAGNIGDHTSWCRPDSLLQGHGVWHVLAAAALWWLGPAVGARASTMASASRV